LTGKSADKQHFPVLGKGPDLIVYQFFQPVYRTAEAREADCQVAVYVKIRPMFSNKIWLQVNEKFQNPKLFHFFYKSTFSCFAFKKLFLPLSPEFFYLYASEP